MTLLGLLFAVLIISALFGPGMFAGANPAVWQVLNVAVAILVIVFVLRLLGVAF